MRKLYNFNTRRGGEFPYTAPEIEVFEVTVEQGFAVSPENGVLDYSQAGDSSWSGTGDNNLGELD